MAKILDIESGVDPIPAEVQPQENMTEAEKMIQNLMRRAYTLGIQSGMRTMCVSMLAQMEQTKKMNPQRRLNLLRQMCMKNIENQNKAMQSAKSTDTDTETEGEITTNNEKENESNV